ncbi:MAG TPA: CrcB family protein [Acidimicrobiales bacterium]|nr:CrcB family protein [Acidimicrobiales bacterium]
MRPNITLTPRQLAVAIVAVAIGGGVGTLARDLLLKLQPPTAPVMGWTGYAPLQTQSWTQAIPWVLLAINFVGVVIATWALAHPLRQHDPNDPTRLLVITGFFGGFTSYSSLFVDFDILWHRSVAGCLLVAAAAILSGIVAAWLGLQVRFRL